jgi:hypothetical protein
MALPDAPAPTVRWTSGLNALLGLWLIVAPFALGYLEPAARWNDILVGIVIASLAALRAFGRPAAPAWSWTNVALGVWLLIAPFLLSYNTSAALWNDVVVGLIVVVLGWWSARASRPAAAPRT